MSSLEIDSVHFSYGQHPILSSIYLKVDRGEVVGFLGRNGCGKSTLMQVIFGTLRGASQSVRVGGQYFERLYQSRQVMFLPQEGLFPNFLTVRKAAALYQSDMEALQVQPEVVRYLDYRFGQLSGGIAKFIETLIVLHAPVAFILLDEPFSFIAPVLVERLIPVIRQVAQRKAILLTDHQYKSILTVSDRLYLLRGQCLYPVEDIRDLQDMGYVK